MRWLNPLMLLMVVFLAACGDEAIARFFGPALERRQASLVEAAGRIEVVDAGALTTVQDDRRGIRRGCGRWGVRGRWRRYSEVSDTKEPV